MRYWELAGLPSPGWSSWLGLGASLLRFEWWGTGFACGNGRIANVYD